MTSQLQLDPSTLWRYTPAGYGLKIAAGPNPGSFHGFQRWRHVKLISQEVARTMRTPGGRLILTFPNQVGKSTTSFLGGGVFALDQDPSLRLALVTYGSTLSEWWSRQLRDVIADNPDLLRVRIRGGRGAKVSDWETTEGGGLRAVGIGGGITGRPVDGLFIDDPLKDWKEAESETARKDVWDHWLTVLERRLSPKAWVVVIMTRQHEADLVGMLTDPKVNGNWHEWRVVRVPQVAETDAERKQLGEGPDPLGRQPGEVLEPRHQDEAFVARVKRSLGTYLFSALQQGRPAPAEGGIFKRAWWKFWRVLPPLDVFDEIIQSWDMSFKDTDGSDYVVGAVWARRGAHMLLLDLVRDRMEFVEAVRAVRTLSAKWPTSVAKLVEDAANGPAVISALQSTVPGLIAWPPFGSKVARARAVSPYVEAGNVWLPDPDIAPWVHDFIDEHAKFPNVAHDDQVDSTSQALARLGALGDGEVGEYEDLRDRGRR